jgi:hypothetical protein
VGNSTACLCSMRSDLQVGQPLRRRDGGVIRQHCQRRAPVAVLPAAAGVVVFQAAAAAAAVLRHPARRPVQRVFHHAAGVNLVAEDDDALRRLRRGAERCEVSFCRRLIMSSRRRSLPATVSMSPIDGTGSTWPRSRASSASSFRCRPLSSLMSSPPLQSSTCSSTPGGKG